MTNPKPASPREWRVKQVSDNPDDLVWEAGEFVDAHYVKVERARADAAEAALKEFSCDENWLIESEYADRPVRSGRTDWVYIGKWDPRVFADHAGKLPNTKPEERKPLSDFYKPSRAYAELTAERDANFEAAAKWKEQALEQQQRANDFEVERDALQDQLKWSLKNEEQYKKAFKEESDRADSLAKELEFLKAERPTSKSARILAELSEERDKLKAALEEIAKILEQNCPRYMAHPQSVWFDEHVIAPAKEIARRALGGGDEN